MTNKRILALIGTILALIIALGVTVAFAQDPDDNPEPDTEDVPLFPFPGKFGRQGFQGLPEDLTPKDELLANALGISVDDLAAAREEARVAAIEQAVDAGLLTREQADLMAAQRALREYTDGDALMAEALGISLADLQAAREEGKSLSTLLEESGLTFAEFAQAKQDAYQAAVQQAVDDNALTQAQADLILSGGIGGRGFMGPDGFGRHGFGHHGFGPNGDNGIDLEALLAEALGISVEDLQAAQEEAHAAALAELVDGGYMTQEQADLMTARQALKEYVDPDALTAEALGISLAELQAAREEGTSLPALLEELGLTFAEFAQAKQDAYQSAVQQAVDDNVLTQEQADQILSGAAGGPGFGFRGPGGFGRHGGPGGFGGNGGFRGFGPFSGETEPAGMNI